MQKKTIGVLGATGSVGKASFNILKNHLDKFQIIYLTANENIKFLVEQVIILKPKFLVVKNQQLCNEIKILLGSMAIEILCGEDGLKYVSSIKCDIVISAIVGAAGLLPTLEAIKVGSNIALANKESLVCAGNLLMQEAQKSKINIIPIDSEHNGIMQIFYHKENIEKIILTASGGPFRDYTYEQMKHVTVEQALKHPTWKMGEKISIDSATMFNKGFEIIEAFHLFALSKEKIDVVIHPQSIIHAMVQYYDGSTLAQMSYQSMEIPIQIALFWPNRSNENIKTLDLMEHNKLEFYRPDRKKFKSLDIIAEVLKVGHNAGIVVNAANEIAVSEFLCGNISFIEIYDIVEEILSIIPQENLISLEEILGHDQKVRFLTKELIEKKMKRL